MGRTGGSAKPPKDKDKKGDKATKEQIERENGAERRLEASANISQSIKDNDGLGAAAVAGAAAAASIRGQGSKSKDLSAVGSPQRKDRSEDEKSVEPDSPELVRRKRNGNLKRTAQTTSSSEEEAEASEQSVAASETEDKEVTANAKIIRNR